MSQYLLCFLLYNRELLSVATLCLLKDSCHSLNNNSACHYTQGASPGLNEERKTNDEKYFVIFIQQITIHLLLHKNSAQRIRINGKLILISSENTRLNHSFSAIMGVRKCLGENQIKWDKHFANLRGLKNQNNACQNQLQPFSNFNGFVSVQTETKAFSLKCHKLL